jgi:DNA-binding transcriptional ArsR family regulator
VRADELFSRHNQIAILRICVRSNTFEHVQMPSESSRPKSSRHSRPHRIAIVEALHGGELPAGKLMERLQVEQANLSQHLSVLRATGARESEGREPGVLRRA